jgi:hypothetical protein
METEQQLAIITKAWGKQRGFCFFPYIRGNARDKKERILSYNEGPPFMWPKDKVQIIAHLNQHKGDDVYWCPSLFEGPKRRLELAMDEHALWADLDEVDPREIEDYPPTISWETSPGRYQALWLISGGDIQGASWAGRENQRLTYHLRADQSGWDTTQLLRIPGWANHKPEYRDAENNPAQGRLINGNGRRYLVDEFDELPDVPNAAVVVDILEDEIDRVDRHAIWGNVRLKVSHRVREFMAAKSASGDRSDTLWEIERELADAGCSVPEIVALVRTTVWNKYTGRSDEIRRLTTEAAKAVALRSTSSKDPNTLEFFRDAERPTPVNLFLLVKDLPTPQWLVRDVLTQGAVGFIAGQPKSFKSWCALDLALSVSSGQPYLGHFPVELPGPVLYIQEEDSGPMVKNRLNKIWPGKIGDKLKVDEGEVHWLPGEDVLELPPITSTIGATFIISDPGWQVWLDEILEKGYQCAEDTTNPNIGNPYRLIVLDPLMMIAGEVEETRAQQMTEKIFKPLKTLARKHHLAVQIVHHMKKTDPRGAPQRGGQLLLGSVANHAWAEDSQYFKSGRGGTIVCEQESKQAPVPGFTISHIRNRRWEPVVTVDPSNNGDDESHDHGGHPTQKSQGAIREAPRSNGHSNRRMGKTEKFLLEATEPQTASQIAKATGLSTAAIYKWVGRATAQETVTRTSKGYTLTRKARESLHG